MREKIIIFGIFFISLLLVSCGSTVIKSSSYSKDYIPAEDFNPSAQNWMDADVNMAVSEQGLFFVAGDYLFYLDYQTMKAEPFCFKTDCLHHKEMDSYKVLECDAFLGGSSDIGDFIACYKHKVYTVCVNKTSGEFDLIEMNEDGSARRTVISDLKSKKADRILMHRGVIYFTTRSYSLEGESRSALMALSLVSGNKEPKPVYVASGNDYLMSVFPCRNQIFFYEGVYKEGTAETESMNIMRYDIHTQETESLTTEGMWQIYGVKDDFAIFMIRDGADYQYYSYSLTSGEFAEDSSGITGFTKAHTGWDCHAECISDDMMVFSCFDRVETRSFVSDLYVADSQGNEMCTIPNESWSQMGAQMITIDGEEFMARFSKSYTPFSFKLYRKSDLLKGKVDPLTILEVDDVNQDLLKAYVIRLH